MGLFSWLKPKPRLSVEQLSYDIAYEIFPHYVFHQTQSVLDIVESSPDTAGHVFYRIACQSRGVPFDPRHAASYRLHAGRIDDAHVCIAMEYPQPRPIRLRSDVFEDTAEAIRSGDVVVAPYFSVAVGRPGAIAACYVQGQTFGDEPSAIRSVDREGGNVALGPGPEPSLDAFLADIRRRMAQQGPAPAVRS